MKSEEAAYTPSRENYVRAPVDFILHNSTMLFNSYEFIFFFLPINLFIFFQIGKRGYYQLAIAALVAASLFFYDWWNASYIILLLVSILFNYFIGLTISRPDIYKTLPVSRKSLLIFGIVVNIGLLGYFKYANFLVATSNIFLTHLSN